MNKAYNRINNGKGWEEYPSDKTPLNKPNLDKADIALDEIDNRVITLDSTKATKIEVSELFENVELDERTGIITFTRKNGATVTIDTPMEKIATGIYYNLDTEKLVLPLIDGTSIEVDLSRLMKYDEFLDSDTIAFSVKPNGAVTAIVKEGSIEERHLRPDYLADIRVEEAKAQASADSAAVKADEASGFATVSESFAHGGTGSREGEETDNAKHYSEQAKIYYENLQQAGNVTGVKGNAESSYRTGNVNITPANIGLGSVNNTADSVKNVNSAGNLRALDNNYRQGTDLPSTYPRGVTVFLSDNPANRFNGIAYCTIHTIKGYNNMACMQFLYPYNTHPDKIYFREALYNADSWRPWYEVITSANISSASVSHATSAGSATKATMDSGSNVIKDTYLKKSWIFLGEADWRGGTFTHLIPKNRYSEYLMTAYDGVNFNEFSFQADTLLNSYQAHGDVSSLKIKYDIDGSDFISVSFANNSFVFTNETYNRDVRIYVR